MMKRIALVLALAMVPAAPGLAKKKRTPSTSGQTTAKKQTEKPPAPGDKGVNEGAQGRINSTEDAARDADSPQFQHRP
jgi:hypothetical protein